MSDTKRIRRYATLTEILLGVGRRPEQGGARSDVGLEPDLHVLEAPGGRSRRRPESEGYDASAPPPAERFSLGMDAVEMNLHACFTLGQTTLASF